MSIIVKTLISRSPSILRPFHHPIWNIMDRLLNQHLLLLSIILLLLYCPQSDFCHLPLECGLHIMSTFFHVYYFWLLSIPSPHQLWSSWSTQAVAPTAWQTVRTSMHPPAFQPYGDLRNSSDENACEIDN